MVCELASTCSCHSHNPTCDILDGGPFHESANGLIPYCGRLKLFLAEKASATKPKRLEAFK